MAPIDNGTSFSETATHATAAVASHTGASGKKYYITGVAVSSDKAGAILLVKQGTTIIFQLQVGATHFQTTFNPPLSGASGALVSAEIDGTSACKANIVGFEL